HSSGQTMSDPETEQPPAASLPGDYRPVGGAFDELLEPNGRLRQHWQSLLAYLQRIAPEDVAARRESAQRILREHGATYNTYADAQSPSRPWERDLLPLVIPADEWRQLEAGLLQRARLLNLILADIYGPQTSLKEGLLP